MEINQLRGDLDEAHAAVGSERVARMQAEQQRDTLLAALRDVVTNGEWQGGTDWRITTRVYEMAEAAIRAVETQHALITPAHCDQLYEALKALTLRATETTPDWSGEERMTVPAALIDAANNALETQHDESGPKDGDSFFAEETDQLRVERAVIKRLRERTCHKRHPDGTVFLCRRNARCTSRQP